MPIVRQIEKIGGVVLNRALWKAPAGPIYGFFGIVKRQCLVVSRSDRFCVVAKAAGNIDR